MFISIDKVDDVDIESSDGVVSTINIGGMTVFGFAYLWKLLPINLLSFGQLRSENKHLLYDYKRNNFEVRIKSLKLKFGTNDTRIYTTKLYKNNIWYNNEYNNIASCYNNNNHNNKIDNICNTKKLIKVNVCINNKIIHKMNNNNNKIYMFTVAQKMLKYNKTEVKRAERIRELMWRMGITSTTQLITQLRNNKIENPGCTITDIEIADDIWGPDLGGLKSKSTAKKNIPIPIDRVLPPIRELQTAYGDIMFFNSKPYLVIICKPLDLLLEECLHDRSESELLRATLKVFSKPYRRGLNINTLYFDREAGIISDNFQDKLMNLRGIATYGHNSMTYKDHYKYLKKSNSIEVVSTGATSGIDIIERQIRPIKERLRGIWNTLPYSIPKSLEKFMVKFVVCRLNSEIKSNSLDMMSPRERLTGRKNTKEWIRHGFGDYCQLHTDGSDNVLYSGMTSRTLGGLSLYPVDNVMGTWCYVNLSTWKLVFRNRATSLPITDNIIEHINKAADGNKLIDERIDNSSYNMYVDDNNEQISSPATIIPNYIDESVTDNIDFIDQENVLYNEHVSNNIDNGDNEEHVQYWFENDNMYNVLNESDYISSTNDSNDMNNDNNASRNVNQLGSTIESIDGVNVRRSTRLANQMNVHYMKGTKKESKARKRKEYVKYVAARKVFLAKKVKGNMSTEEAINKLGYAAVKAIVSEIAQLLDKNVLQGRHIDELSYDELKKVITSRMFLREKRNADGIFEKIKARLVAGGHLQDRDIYDNGSSPTASTTAVFMEAAIAAKLCNAVAHIDFSGAFLNADMPEVGDHVVHIRLNKYLTGVLVSIDKSFEEYVNADGTVVCKLNKALYGTIEAARLWYELFVKEATNFGYTVNEVDMCVFSRVESDGSKSVLVLHVDDLFIRATDESMIDRIIKQWGDAYPGVTEHRGRRIEYLGMTFDFTIRGEVTINQIGGIDKLLNECDDIVGECDTPHTGDLFSVNNESSLLDKKHQELFHSRTQSCLYLSKRSKPDIQTAVGFLGRRVLKPTKEDHEKLSRVIRYLRKTRDQGLRFKLGDGKLRVTVYVDASFATHADRKSHTGCCIFIGDCGAVYSKSSRQMIVTKSSAEAELVGATDMAGAYLWIRRYLLSQGYDMEREVLLNQDNQAVLAWLKNGRAKDEKGKHISIRYFWLNDVIKRGKLIVKYCNTESMIADYLSKPLVGALFHKFRNVLLGISSWNV